MHLVSNRDWDLQCARKLGVDAHLQEDLEGLWPMWKLAERQQQSCAGRPVEMLFLRRRALCVMKMIEGNNNLPSNKKENEDGYKKEDESTGRKESPLRVYKPHPLLFPRSYQVRVLKKVNGATLKLEKKIMELGHVRRRFGVVWSERFSRSIAPLQRY